MTAFCTRICKCIQGQVCHAEWHDGHLTNVTCVAHVSKIVRLDYFLPALCSIAERKYGLFDFNCHWASHYLYAVLWAAGHYLETTAGWHALCEWSLENKRLCRKMPKLTWWQQAQVSLFSVGRHAKWFSWSIYDDHVGEGIWELIRVIDADYLNNQNISKGCKF